MIIATLAFLASAFQPLGDTVDVEGLHALIRKRLDHGTMQRVT